MNKDNAKEYLPLVQALAEGKTLEVFKDGEWWNIYAPAFDKPPSRYRIKPEPEVAWSYRLKGGGKASNVSAAQFFFPSAEAAMEGLDEDLWEPVKFMEVVE